jgi:predicted aspartyl protease
LDEINQAFLTLDFGQGELDFLVDTGFVGTLVVGEELFDAGHPTPDGYAEAELAAGQTFVFPCYFVEFEWFGRSIRVRVGGREMAAASARLLGG